MSETQVDIERQHVVQSPLLGCLINKKKHLLLSLFEIRIIKIERTQIVFLNDVQSGAVVFGETKEYEQR